MQHGEGVRNGRGCGMVTYSGRDLSELAAAPRFGLAERLELPLFTAAERLHIVNDGHAHAHALRHTELRIMRISRTRCRCRCGRSGRCHLGLGQRRPRGVRALALALARDTAPEHEPLRAACAVTLTPEARSGRSGEPSYPARDSRTHVLERVRLGLVGAVGRDEHEREAREGDERLCHRDDARRPPRHLRGWVGGWVAGRVCGRVGGGGRRHDHRLQPIDLTCCWQAPALALRWQPPAAQEGGRGTGVVGVVACQPVVCGWVGAVAGEQLLPLRLWPSRPPRYRRRARTWQSS